MHKLPIVLEQRVRRFIVSSLLADATVPFDVAHLLCSITLFGIGQVASHVDFTLHLYQ